MSAWMVCQSLDLAVNQVRYKAMRPSTGSRLHGVPSPCVEFCVICREIWVISVQRARARSHRRSDVTQSQEGSRASVLCQDLRECQECQAQRNLDGSLSGAQSRFIYKKEMDRRDFPSLVPLSTLQHTLIRNLYPQFRFEDDLGGHIFDPLMTAPTIPPQAQTIRSPSPSTDVAAAAAAAAELQEADAASNSSSALKRPAPEEGHKCQWVDCDKVMPDPETLYNHLCNDHIGRKSTGNLCLTCMWKDCNTTCAKRDHITSHLRGTPPVYSYTCALLTP